MKSSLLITLLSFVMVWFSVSTSRQEDEKMLYKITGKGSPVVLVPGGLTAVATAKCRNLR